MVEIYATKISEKLDSDLFIQLLDLLDIKRKKKIQRFIKWEDSHRALFAGLLIRHIIIEITGLKNKEISFNTSELGKPYLENCEQFHFNLSHSGDWIVCVIDENPVGIDIEQIKPIDLKISKRFFSKEEHTNLVNTKDTNKFDYFYTLWTLKESYIKAIGKGLSVPLNSFTFKLSSCNEIQVKVESKTIRNIYFKKYVIEDNYIMAVCAYNKKIPKYFTIKDNKEIINSFL
jgi:4'-phosphopantetheinyl transferase